MDFVYIKVFIDTLDALEPLDDAERGRLFTALLEYAKTGVTPELLGNERFLFPLLRAQIDRDATQIEELSKVRSEAGKLGGRPKKQKNQMLSEKTNAFSESKKSIDNRIQNIDYRQQTIEYRQESTTVPAPKDCIQNVSGMDTGGNTTEQITVTGNATCNVTVTPANNDKSSRQKYGEYGWILLSEQEYRKLLKDLGQAEADRCIAYVDELAQQTGNKNKWKDWNLVVRKAAREGWGLGKRIVDQKPAPKRETSYDLDEIDQLITAGYRRQRGGGADEL